MRRRTVLGLAGPTLIALPGCTSPQSSVSEGDIIEDHSIDGLRGSPDDDGYSVPYKEYSSSERDRIREIAKAVDYDELVQSIDDYRGFAVRWTGWIRKIQRDVTHNSMRIHARDGNFVLGSWAGDRFTAGGDRFEEGDEVVFWGECIGMHTDETAAERGATDPMLAIAALELFDEWDGEGFAESD